MEEKLIKTVFKKNFIVRACEKKFRAYSISMATENKHMLDTKIIKGLFCRDETETDGSVLSFSLIC